MATAGEHTQTASSSASTSGSRSLLEVLMSGFGKGALYAALAAVAVMALVQGGVASEWGSRALEKVGPDTFRAVGAPGGFMQGMLDGAWKGLQFLLTTPIGWMTMGAAGAAGGFMAYQTNQQEQAVSQLAEQNQQLREHIRNINDPDQYVNVNLASPQNGHGRSHRERVAKNGKSEVTVQQGAADIEGNEGQFTAAELQRRQQNAENGVQGVGYV